MDNSYWTITNIQSVLCGNRYYWFGSKFEKYNGEKSI